MSLPFLFSQMEPQSWSRNYDDEFPEDEIDNLPEEHTPILLWGRSIKDKVQNGLRTKHLIVCLPLGASAFINSLNIQKKIVGSLLLPEIQLTNTSIQPSVNDNVCFIYSVNNLDESEVLLVVCQYEVPEERSHAWTAKLFEKIIPERVTVLDTILDCDYKAFTEIAPPLLRKIETTSAKKLRGTSQSVCADLEAPNLLQGGPAALITHVNLFTASITVYSANLERFLQHSTSALKTLGC